MSGAEQITREEALRVISEAEEVPMGHSLGVLFAEFAALDEVWRLNEMSTTVLLASIPGFSEVKGFGTLELGFTPRRIGREERYRSAHLCILPGCLQACIKNRAMHLDAFLALVGGAARAGTWAYGLGERMQFRLSLRLPQSLVLPSPEARWILRQFIPRLDILTSELHLDAPEQPQFWTGVRDE